MEALLTDKSLDHFARLVGDRIAAQRQPAPSITFGELFKLYYDRHAKAQKSPSNAQYFFKRHGAKFADTPVNALKQFELQAWVDEISSQRGPYGAKRAIDMLAAVINWGIRRGHVELSSNPCRNVDRKAAKSRTRFATPQEIARLADALRDEAPIWRDFVWLALFTFQRRGDVLAMRWDQIDFDLAQWIIPDSKNGDEIVVALSSKTIALLYRRRTESDPKNPWVFPGEGKSGHLVDAKGMWKRVCKRAQIKNLRIHDLRRTGASYLAMQGASAYQIGKALGHRDPRSTAVYARLDLNSVRGEIEKVHDTWLMHCMNQIPTAEAHPAITVDAKEIAPTPLAKNANVKMNARQQVLIEGRIIVALQHGITTKKELYRKTGGKIQINAREMVRILSEMESRGIIEKYRDYSDLKNARIWHYRLSVMEA